MKILQKILSHGLLIASFVAAFFIYLYRVELFPQWFDKQAQSKATETAEVAEPASGPQPGTPVSTGEEPPSVAAGSGAAEDARAAPEVSAEPVAGREPPTAPEPLSAAAPVRDVEPAHSEPMTEAPATTEYPAEPVIPRADVAAAAQYRPLAPEELKKERYDPVAPVPASVVSAPHYRPLEAKTVATVPAKVSGESDFQSQLEGARQHYWRRDVGAAEKAYRQLTESYPQRAEVWGELGNLYYAQNKLMEATDAYYRAIELLIEQGDAGQARQMLGAMYQLNSDKANDLERRLRQVGG